MGECMEFPATPAEFIAQYSFNDKEEVYTNGSELIPVFRVEQMLDHYYHNIEEERNAILVHNGVLQKQNALLRSQYEQLDELYTKAVDRVNRVHFAKLKVEHQLELLQSMIGTVLARFQVDTEED